MEEDRNRCAVCEKWYPRGKMSKKSAASCLYCYAKYKAEWRKTNRETAREFRPDAGPRIRSAWQATLSRSLQPGVSPRMRAVVDEMTEGGPIARKTARNLLYLGRTHGKVAITGRYSQARISLTEDRWYLEFSTPEATPAGMADPLTALQAQVTALQAALSAAVQSGTPAAETLASPATSHVQEHNPCEGVTEDGADCERSDAEQYEWIDASDEAVWYCTACAANMSDEIKPAQSVSA